MPTSRRRKAQQGAAAIELALVFSLLFTLLWGVISYTFPLILLQAMNKATAEAIRVAATVPGTSADYEGAVKAIAAQELDAQMKWLPAGWVGPLATTSLTNISFSSNAACPPSRPACLVTVRLRYSDYENQPIVPSITLPGIGTIPQVPQHLEATAEAIL